MKTQVTFLAACLLGAGLATAQTTNTYSTTSTTYTTSPVTTDSSNMTNGTYVAPTNTSDNNGTSTTSGYNTNTAGTPAYATTTTTTEYSSTDNQTRRNRKDDDKPWGKEGKFGVYVGANLSQFVNEPIPDDAFRAGWQAGLYGRTGGTVFGQIGLEYRNSTSSLIRNGGSGTTVSQVSGRIDQHFIAIPAYVGARIGSALGLRVQVGAELASLVAVGNNNFGLGRDDLNRTILNGLAGIGINLGPVTVDAVYNHGFVNVFDAGADTRRNILALNVGFRF
ncbi:PorT family protein [Spirosoma sp. KUDC1026]|uniref:PorT family protein n=1 Tax=Spirosoma sp. KUDC1026 TaxID=2745947 RepID=UPI00159BE145|nr:PorT family protein [Spirosoma sp. KUDC1026]QKZ14373.1 PorT family protein [Spirosoma sp. KUDC1026]